MMRSDNRKNDQPRPISVEKGYSNSSAAVLFRMGNTVVNCSATVSTDLPSFVEEGKGWITAEYSMLPTATSNRNRRERSKVSGRTIEIQRLIGRSLRGAANMEALAGYSIFLDCDVLYADGGTRCASISGSYLAAMLALRELEKDGALKAEEVFPQPMAAVSVGIVDDVPLLDLDYSEDFQADVDMNIIMTADHNIIEIQGTAEGNPFSQKHLLSLLELGQKGISEIIEIGQAFLEKQEQHS